MGILRTDRVSGLGGANAIKGSVYLHGGDDSSGSQTMNMKDSSLAIGTNEFCCDFWMYWVDIPSHGVRIVGNINQGDYSTAQSWAYLRFADGTSRLWNGSSWVSTGADNFVAGRWYHIAIIRNPNNFQGLYINGSLQSTTVQNTNNWTNDEFDINGRASDGAESGRIFFSNVRLTIGSGASDLGGIVPVGESEVLADTKILCCNSPGNVLNESAQGIPITTGRNSTANASVGTASRFTPNSPVGFSTTTDVGSQYGSTFDGFGSFATSTYMVPPGGNTRERNRGRALFGGGSTIDNTIQSLIIQSQGNTIDFGDLSTGRYETECASSSTRGIWGGGYTESPNVKVDVIEFVTIANSSNTTDFGNLTVARGHLAGMCNSTRGVFANGSTDPGPNVNTLDYITIATAGNATDFGDSTTASKPMGGGRSSTTRGIFTLGNAPSAVNTIEYITIATTANSQDFGDLTGFSGWGKGAGNISSGTRAILGGGHEALNTIEYITIATLGNGTDFGDLIVGRRSAFAAGSKTRGVFGGGKTPSQINNIEYIEIATTGNALDFGDMINSKSFSSGLSDCHGGLE